jgi:hypothetical protein
VEEQGAPRSGGTRTTKRRTSPFAKRSRLASACQCPSRDEFHDKKHEICSEIPREDPAQSELLPRRPRESIFATTCINRFTYCEKKHISRLFSNPFAISRNFFCILACFLDDLRNKLGQSSFFFSLAFFSPIVWLPEKPELWRKQRFLDYGTRLTQSWRRSRRLSKGSFDRAEGKDALH